MKIIEQENITLKNSKELQNLENKLEIEKSTKVLTSKIDQLVSENDIIRNKLNEERNRVSQLLRQIFSIL